MNHSDQTCQLSLPRTSLHLSRHILSLILDEALPLFTLSVLTSCGSVMVAAALAPTALVGRSLRDG